MPAKDTFHSVVVRALVKDGWSITDDPLRLAIGKKDLFVDLGAEKLLAAEKSGQKIAVEIKSFVGPSLVAGLEQALGQFILYQDVLARLQPDRVLHLAIPDTAYEDVFEEAIGKVLLENGRLRLVVFDAEKERITQWIP